MSLLGSIGNLFKTVSGVASFIPGPIGTYGKIATGALNLLGGLNQSNQQQGMANSASGQANYLRGLQSNLLGNQYQNALDTYNNARTYDPGRDTEQAMNAYDIGSERSLTRDLGAGAANLALRGLTGSSDASGFATKVLGDRASERARYQAGLALDEGNRKRAVMNNAAGTLGNAASALGGGSNQNLGASQYYQQNAGQYDPSASIASLSSVIDGITKKKPNNWDPASIRIKLPKIF